MSRSIRGTAGDICAGHGANLRGVMQGETFQPLERSLSSERAMLEAVRGDSDFSITRMAMKWLLDILETCEISRLMYRLSEKMRI